MRKLLTITSLFIISILLTYCSGSVKETKDDPLKPLYIKATNLIEKDGAVAAVGEGISTRRDLAHEKARAQADGALVEVFSKKVDRLKKNYIEEVGQDKAREVIEFFNNTTKVLASKVLRGAYEKDYEFYKDDKDRLVFGVLMVISPKTVNNSILDEMKNRKKILYDKWISSQAFKDMQKEIEKYEKSNQN